jgi:hypothetical protein
VIRELDDIPLPAQRGQVEVLVGAEQRIDPAAVRRVGVEDALTLTQEDAHPVRVHSRPDTEVVAFERRLVAPHEVVDDQLAAPVEQVGQASLANRPGEDVVLVDLDHRQGAALLVDLVFRAAGCLLLGSRDNPDWAAFRADRSRRWAGSAACVPRG